VRHDNGSQYVSRHFQSELAFLGIESSPSFMRSPEGNGCIERFFRTLKEQLLWVRNFVDAEDVRRAVTEWAKLYNEHWLIERHGHRPPAASITIAASGSTATTAKPSAGKLQRAAPPLVSTLVAPHPAATQASAIAHEPNRANDRRFLTMVRSPTRKKCLQAGRAEAWSEESSLRPMVRPTTVSRVGIAGPRSSGPARGAARAAGCGPEGRGVGRRGGGRC